jgi:hypothetical protein
VYVLQPADPAMTPPVWNLAVGRLSSSGVRLVPSLPR